MCDAIQGRGFWTGNTGVRDKGLGYILQVLNSISLCSASRVRSSNISENLSSASWLADQHPKDTYCSCLGAAICPVLSRQTYGARIFLGR